MRDKHIRADQEFAKELKKIKLERIKRGLDKEMKSDRRLTTAIRRHRFWRDMKEDIIKAELPKDKRGAVMDIIVLAIVGFIAIVFLGVWVFAHGQMTDVLTGIDEGSLNISGISQDTIGQADLAYQNHMKWLGLAIIFGMVIGILVTNYLIRANPVFFVAYVVVTVGAIIISTYISNSYLELLQSSPMAAELINMGGASYILLHLPLWVTVVGFFGAILLFANIMRTRDAGGIV
jgi:hypothetical protein